MNNSEGQDEGSAHRRWVSVGEIANHLGVRPDTIYKWIGRKNLPAHKIGRLWKFQVNEVDAWVREGKARETAIEAD